MASSKKPRHADLAARLETFLKQTVRPGQRLLLGFSGGLDSTVLLHLLLGLRTECGVILSALHVNHGVSPNSDLWQRHCADICAAWQVSFHAERVNVPRNSGLGIEAAARAARYAALMAQSADRVMLAHHQDDQAETLLLQLLRGAGIKGLSAMPVATSTMLRPLLDTPRSVLEQYARVHGLRWIEDESNLDLAYDRNFLRHQVFPALEKRFPATRATLARSASHLAEAAGLLDEMAHEDAVRWIRGGRLEVAGLRAMSGPRARNLLRYWLSGYLTELPSTRCLQEIHRQLTEARGEAMIELALTGGHVRRYRDEAWFDQASIDGPSVPVIWHGEPELQLPGGRLIFEVAIGAGISRARLASASLHIRVRQGGEQLRLYRHGPSRSLKNLFQEAGIPAWQRPNLPLVYLDDDLIAVPGVGVASEWQAASGEEGLIISWRRA